MNAHPQKFSIANAARRLAIPCLLRAAILSGGDFHGLQGNEKFPDIKGLCDAIHGLGLKFGIYSTPWETSYAGYPGGSSENPEGSWTKPAGKTVKNNVRDLWRQKDLGQFTDEFSLPVAPHSGEMGKISG